MLHLFQPDRLSVTPAGRLQATLDLLYEVDRIARPADAVVTGWFRTRRDIGDNDRGHISALLYALMRHHARLGWWLAKHGREPTPRSRLLAWLVLDGRKTRDQIQALFTGGKFAPAVLTDHERTLIVKLQGSPIDHPSMPDEVRARRLLWSSLVHTRETMPDGIPGSRGRTWRGPHQRHS